MNLFTLYYAITTMSNNSSYKKEKQKLHNVPYSGNNNVTYFPNNCLQKLQFTSMVFICIKNHNVRWTTSCNNNTVDT